MTSPEAPRLTTVLFDLDGTLADTVPLILASYRHTMSVHRGRELPDALWLDHLGRPLRDSLRAFAEDEAEVGAMLDTYLTFQRREHDRMVRPFDGVEAAVGTLAARGLPLAVVTSKTREEMTGRTLERCRLGAHFEVVVTADDVARGKPDPEPVLLALERLGVEPGPGVLFVGDSPHDLVAGRAAGVRTAAALWGPFERARLEAHGPDRVLERIDDVVRLVG